MKASKQDRRRLPAFARSRKGSALVLVISVILLLTMLGTVSLFASLANMRMSSRYSDWSRDYFASDSSLEEALSRIDALLKTAEAYAGDYMEQKYYRLSLTELGTLSVSSPEALNVQEIYDILDDDSQAQAFFKAHGFPWDSYAEYYESLPKDEKGEPTASYLSEREYLDRLSSVNEDMYERLYFYFSHKLLTGALEPGGALYDLTSGSVTVSLDSVIDDVFAESFNYDKNHWKINLKSATVDGDDKHTISAVISIKLPGAETVISYNNNPIYGNPLWGYALAAEGDINFTSGAAVYGDIFAASSRDKNYAGAVGIQGGANVTVSGNIYANGDVEAFGDGAKLTVKTAASGGASYGKKLKIYGDSPLLMKQSDPNLYDGSSNEYREGSAEEGVVPLLYDDYNWGNVYCHDLKVDEGATNAEIELNGNLIAADDIEMNGSESAITLEGNFVGINSEAEKAGEAVDPNASSAIINNQAIDGGSSINLNGNLIVPGIAYAEYAKGPETDIAGKEDYYFTDGDKVYYPTVESVAARNQASFEYYLYTDNGAFIVFYINGTKYYLKELSSESFENKLNDFASAGAAFEPIGSRIFIRGFDELKGYSLGVVIGDAASAGAGRPVDLKNAIASYSVNENKYRAASSKGQLKNVQEAKTKHFGYYDQSLTMGGLVGSKEPNTVYYFSGYTVSKRSSGTLSIDGEMSGIVYSTGDLTVAGSGTFKGVILCEGNVTIAGNVTLKYDEDVVSGIVSDSKSLSARAFFKPGCVYAKKNGGKTYAYYEDYDSTSGIKTETKRYRIESWLEGAE